MVASPQSIPKKRAYRSHIRQRQAEETRRRILTATRDLLASRGYAGTTLVDIAEAAEVSPKTVTAIFGSKRAILAEIVNPEAFGSPVQELLDELRSTPGPARRLALVAQITRRAYEPRLLEHELLRTASGVAAELADLASEIEGRRRQRQSQLIGYLDKSGLLRQGLSREEATDILWGLTGYDLYRMLVVEQHWPLERYENWLTEVLIQQLLEGVGLNHDC